MTTTVPGTAGDGDSTATDWIVEDRPPSVVFDALGDETSRMLLRRLHACDAPLSVQDMVDELDVSLTSIYRKLDRLTAAGLVIEEDAVEGDGHRRSRYRPGVDRIDVRLDTDDDFEVLLYPYTVKLGPFPA